jgi:hypothetical protein
MTNNYFILSLDSKLILKFHTPLRFTYKKIISYVDLHQLG